MMYITLVVRQDLANHLAKLMLSLGDFTYSQREFPFQIYIHRFCILRQCTEYIKISIHIVYIWILDKINSSFYSVIQRPSVERGTV